MSSSLILCNNESFLDQIVTFDQKCILYDNQQWPARWLDWEEAPGHFQIQTCTRKGHGHYLVVCCLSDPQLFSESRQNHYIWEVCSANRWDALKTAASAVGIGQQKWPSSPWQRLNARHITNTSKVEWIGLWSFPLFPIFTWPVGNRLPLLQTSRKLFAGKALP